MKLIQFKDNLITITRNPQRYVAKLWEKIQDYSDGGKFWTDETDLDYNLEIYYRI